MPPAQMRQSWSLVCPGLVLSIITALCPSARGERVTLTPAADTTLLQVAPDNNLGGATFFNGGTARNGNRNRGLLQFDFNGLVPSQARILSVDLVLEVVREPSSSPVPSTFGLHRVLRPWGEGDTLPEEPNSPGLGGIATAGEATWIARFAFTPETWASPGGASGVDYLGASSSEQFVYGIGESPYAFNSTPALVADAQLWLDNPQANYGWMLISQSENVGGTARSFGSREGDLPPLLMVEYEIVPEPGPGTLLAAASTALAVALRLGQGTTARLARRRRSSGSDHCTAG